MTNKITAVQLREMAEACEKEAPVWLNADLSFAWQSGYAAGLCKIAEILEQEQSTSLVDHLFSAIPECCDKCHHYELKIGRSRISDEDICGLSKEAHPKTL